jgi:hypothetical protein
MPVFNLVVDGDRRLCQRHFPYIRTRLNFLLASHLPEMRLLSNGKGASLFAEWLAHGGLQSDVRLLGPSRRSMVEVREARPGPTRCGEDQWRRAGMCRRRLARILIVLVLQPWLTCAHAHAGVSEHDPSGRVRPPHFHLRFLFFLWRQPGADPVQPTSHTPGLEGGAAPQDHDADAIYLPSAVLLGWDDGPHADSPVPPPEPAVGASEDVPFLACICACREPATGSLAASPGCPILSRTRVLLV